MLRIGTCPGHLRETAARVAERAGQRQRAGRLHLQLGEEALEQGALHTAVAAMRHAADLLAATDDRDNVDERLVEAFVLAGRVEDAVVLGERLVGRLTTSAQLRCTSAWPGRPRRPPDG
jgi:hypothetical protein